MNENNSYKSLIFYLAPMAIFSVWIISRAGGLIYQYERNAQTIEVEKTFSYPLDFVLKEYDDKVVVAFGQRDGVKGFNSLLLDCRYVVILFEMSHHLSITYFRHIAFIAPVTYMRTYLYNV